MSIHTNDMFSFLQLDPPQEPDLQVAPYVLYIAPGKIEQTVAGPEEIALHPLAHYSKFFWPVLAKSRFHVHNWNVVSSQGADFGANAMPPPRSWSAPYVVRGRLCRRRSERLHYSALILVGNYQLSASDM